MLYIKMTVYLHHEEDEQTRRRAVRTFYLSLLVSGPAPVCDECGVYKANLRIETASGNDLSFCASCLEILRTRLKDAARQVNTDRQELNRRKGVTK